MSIDLVKRLRKFVAGDALLAEEAIAEAADEIERLRADRVGWEVEGFIDRLTKRNETNSERLVLEAISHLRTFSRDCDALRESNREAADEIERLRAEIERLRDELRRAENERLR